MLRTIVLVAWIPLIWQPLRGQAPGVGIKAGQNQKKETAFGGGKGTNNERGTESAPLIIETHPRLDTPEEAAEHKAENDTKEYRDGWTFRLTIATTAATGVIVILTGGLLIVGWRGVGAANRTLRQIRRQANLMSRQNSLAESQAKLMDRQTAMMEAQFDQSITLNNWRISKISGLNSVTISADLINLSTYSMIIIEGHLQIELGLHGSVEYNLGKGTFLPPNKPYTIKVEYDMGTPPENGMTTFMLQTRGSFSYEHRITKKRIDQPVIGMIHFGNWSGRQIWDIYFTPFDRHMNPEVQKGADPQQSNGR